MLPRYKYLLTYRYSEIIFDLINAFCLRYLSDLGNLSKIPTRRTVEQITQAARSCKQNTIEAVSDGVTSKKIEIKLLGIAYGSIEEVIADLEDYLRLRGLKIWPKTDSRITEFRKVAYRSSDLSNLSNLGEFIEKPVLPKDPEIAANFLLTLCHLESYLLSRQIAKAEVDFVEKGGYTENLYRKRRKNRDKFNL